MPTNNFDAQWLVDWFEELKCKQTAHFMCLMSNMFLLGREYNKKRRMQRTGIDTIRERHAKAMNPINTSAVIFLILSGALFS